MLALQCPPIVSNYQVKVSNYKFANVSICQCINSAKFVNLPFVPSYQFINPRPPFSSTYLTTLSPFGSGPTWCSVVAIWWRMVTIRMEMMEANSQMQMCDVAQRSCDPNRGGGCYGPDADMGCDVAQLRWTPTPYANEYCTHTYASTIASFGTDTSSLCH